MNCVSMGTSNHLQLRNSLSVGVCASFEKEDSWSVIYFMNGISSSVY